ncbi:Small-conductance mechanosensitive channel [Lysobacter dokdonensis DS-58]|uniref:Small-conductance mechanosensitive channel n=1 Tax=Lysobacter dokdonensis DS-58 TaxID=1300345 RepID=A0A0A2X569_9GAMM|nr:mechanosensitive ion channel family protein [Lysobacter dokdonensis]KGQ20419.1 Small-conductance mechanosensitive channel [Lysobacter dokdonensis DS-58]
MTRSIAARIAPLLFLACLASHAATPAVTATLPVAASTAPATVDAVDHALSKRVEARLETQPALKEVEAAVVNRGALLQGEVLTKDDIKMAGAIAAQTQGIERVENRVELSTKLSDRFQVAMQAVTEKLVRLVAATPLLVVAIAIILLSAWIGRRLARRMKWMSRVHSNNPYMEALLRRLVQGLITLAGILIALDLLGASSLVGAVLGSAGVIGLVLGFAFKDIAENYIAGILLSLRRPFAPGDHVVVDRVHEGKVVALTSRTTLLMTLDGNQVALPNALVFRSVVLNYTENPKRRFDFIVPLDPGASVGDALKLGLERLRGIGGVLEEPAPNALIVEYLHDQLKAQFLGWVDQRQNSVPRVRSEAMRAVKSALDKGGVRRAGMPASAVQPAMPTMEHAMHVDTSKDKDIDAQLAEAQRKTEDVNLLDDKSPATPE